MRLSSPRIAPLEDSESSGEAAEQLQRAAQNGRVLNIFRTLAHHPKLMKRWTVFGNHILAKSTLDPRERELVILRIGWLCKAEYEWGQHVLIGLRSGLDGDDIRRIQAGPDASGWTPFDRHG